MSANVILQLGPARSGKTHEMLRLYREALRRRGPAIDDQPALWLAPTSRTAALVRQELLTGGFDACLSPGIMTFDQLTELILSHGEAAPAARMSNAMTRELLRRVVRTALDRGQLSHFRAAATRAGFVDLVADLIRELKRHGIAPAAYAKAGDQRGRAAEHRELAALYTAYEQQLEAHKLFDAEGRHAAARDMLDKNACGKLRQLELVVVDGFTDFTRVQHELLVLLARRAKELHVTLPGDLADVGGHSHSPAAPGSAGGKTYGKKSARLEPPAEPGADDRDARPSLSLGGRRDLFAKVSVTRAELQHFHRPLEIRHQPPRPTAWPALDHLTQHVFRNPRQVPRLSPSAVASLDKLQIVEASGAHDEIVQLARHIKKRLARGEAKPGEIVVVFRSLAGAAPRIREVFADFGIPYSLETGLPLATAAVLRTLLALLRLDDEDWPFRRVVSVLANNTLTAIDDEARRAADWLVHDLQTAKGRARLLDRVAGLAAEDRPAKELTEHAQRRSREAKAALAALQLLASSLDELPASARPADWPDAMERLGQQLGLAPSTERRTDNLVRLCDPSPDGQDCPSYIVREDPAWQTLVAHFVALDRLNAALGEPQRPLTRRELIHWLVDLAGHETLRRPHDDAGRVRVLSAATARTVTARHLYLAGMSEQAFPSPERTGSLASDADYRFFAGVADQQFAASVPQPASRSQEEMLLFYEVLARARESLTISYPALDERAQPLPPSPYVTEIVRALGDGVVVDRVPPQLSPIPSEDQSPGSLADWRVQAAAQAVGNDRRLELLAGIFRADDTRPLAAALEAGLRITHARMRREDFGPAEGLLLSPAVAARLTKRFGAEHRWSPTQWEKYAVCPYRFYLEDVLRLEPLRDLVLETDHRRRGSLLHRVLATFHRAFGAAPADAWAALRGDRPRFIAELSQTLQAAIEAAPREGFDAAMLELDRRQIEKWTALYPEQHEKYDTAWAGFDEPLRPAHFELRFGEKRPGDDGPEDVKSVDAALPLDIGGETIYVAGRIDRIDIGRVGDRTVFNVIDYKSGRRPTLSSDKLASGERLQPALYVMAAEALVFGPGKATPLWAGYWSMHNGVTTRAQYSLQMSVDAVSPSDQWNELQPKIIRRIGQFVADIRTGQFPVDSRDPDCTSHCNFNTICRISQIRSLNKTRPATDT